MAKQYPEATNIRVWFHGHLVTLTDEDDRQKTPEGVEIWFQRLSARDFRPVVNPPQGALEKYKRCRPMIIDMDWEWKEG